MTKQKLHWYQVSTLLAVFILTVSASSLCYGVLMLLGQAQNELGRAITLILGLFVGQMLVHIPNPLHRFMYKPDFDWDSPAPLDEGAKI